MELQYENKFTQLFNANHKRVYNICLNMVQNREDAEDITQEVFVEVYRSMRGFNTLSSVSTWIYGIAVNISLDFVKAKKRKKRFAFITQLFHPETGETLYDVSHFDHPGVIMENKERSQILFDTLNKLPGKQRSAFVLSKIERFSHKEIAEILGVSDKAVEGLVRRAKENLKELLDNLYEERGI